MYAPDKIYSFSIKRRERERIALCFNSTSNNQLHCLLCAHAHKTTMALSNSTKLFCYCTASFVTAVHQSTKYLAIFMRASLDCILHQIPVEIDKFNPNNDKAKKKESRKLV